MDFHEILVEPLEKYLSVGNSISLREWLRRDTAQAHARVDALFGSCDFATEQGYTVFLLAQARAWETLRPLLDDDSMARADALRRDLETLDLPEPEPLRDVSLPAKASLGHRYVLEGSRLGSTVLLRELAASSPELSARASAYLTESARIEPWKQLSTGLQKDRDGCDNDGAIIDDALFVFGLFEEAWRATDSAQAKIG
ncbi:biliverdin-producing heme oxygenase [Sphingomonas sp. SRS2]|uniref:biliverdin-producing heme oxygenase n=1 Tax=Sphingomonas sp. SRS2 TaxID=133190 RepID=UPI001F488192|nr:biliverdin-producing heme oxygenase [Sphingomonas sp. SRS2]